MKWWSRGQRTDTNDQSIVETRNDVARIGRHGKKPEIADFFFLMSSACIYKRSVNLGRT